MQIWINTEAAAIQRSRSCNASREAEAEVAAFKVLLPALSSNYFMTFLECSYSLVLAILPLYLLGVKMNAIKTDILAPNFIIPAEGHYALQLGHIILDSTMPNIALNKQKLPFPKALFPVRMAKAG